MRKRESVLGSLLLVGASYTGYNMGSGFVTGTEGLQFFASWGSGLAPVCVAIALAVALPAVICIYVSNFNNKFTDNSQIFGHLFGERIGKFFDFFLYLNFVLLAFTMTSGAGATLNQYFGVPVYVGAVMMGVLCILTSLLGLQKLKKLLSLKCILVVLCIIVLAVKCFSSNPPEAFSGPRIAPYVEKGQIARVGIFGLKGPVLGGVLSAGMLIDSGFAWASANGALCRKKSEAVWEGILSVLFFYLATIVVVRLLLVSIPVVASKEVPILAVMQSHVPSLASVYSFVIVFGIYLSISSKLFVINERFSQGNRKRSIMIDLAIVVSSVVVGSLISFGKLSSFIFAYCGILGMILGIAVVVRTIMDSRKQKLDQVV